ncbi:MAG: Anthranilate phosphoribosyltransferase [Chlamydiia bacterium]|nr:Anthranilate phosphoribosyltransferase [Chlamydiia bacterium]MCH9615736.1 Anthranilate phosphoribosyltransferase [Chlamydiia bacterium]MCH9628861.1 Anthranilate phosphoribosyltransferase [Chlamydiia bacterium]
MDLKKLMRGVDLTEKECEEAVYAMCKGEEPVRSGAFLALLHKKGESAEELYGFAKAMRELMIPFEVKGETLDIVGTGGDGANTVNISTASALLAASCGVKVAKHGNRASSSKCGSADLLEALDYDFDTPTRGDFTFLFAPKFHPAMKEIAPVRKKLGIRTVFNLIGPLVNPTKPTYTLMGVATNDLLENMASVLQKFGTKRSLVFHGNGLDELSTLGPCDVIEVTKTEKKRYRIDPSEYGFKKGTIEELKGGDASLNIKLLKEALTGKEGAIFDTLVLNAGVAVYVYGKAASIEEGIALAKKAAKDGSAWIF